MARAWNEFHTEFSCLSTDLADNSCQLMEDLGVYEGPGGVPIIGDFRRNQCVCQNRCDESSEHEYRAHVHCCSETPETLRNQPPIESYEGSLGKIESNIEEVTRDENSLKEA
jgi:hypothetical protein